VERTVTWASGEAYEAFMGRWSALIAQQFLDRVGGPRGGKWLDLGCGTGALSRAVLGRGVRDVYGVDPSADFVAHGAAITRARFTVGDAQRLPFRDGTFGAVVSALVLNFIPDLTAALAEVHRVLGPGGTAAAYVWDYSGEMQFLRRFWDAAFRIDESSAALDEGKKFTIARPERLEHAFASAEFSDVRTWPIEVPTRFRDFDDYWQPFLGGTGPAGGFVVSLDERRRAALREDLRQSLPSGPDGSIDLVARAWAVRATRP
jgi:ubiquinone/menaquinone biosynthesis C-methylase UbiE